MATLTDVDADAMRQRLVVKESLTQAFKELRETETSGAELPDAGNYSNKRRIHL